MLICHHYSTILLQGMDMQRISFNSRVAYCEDGQNDKHRQDHECKTCVSQLGNRVLISRANTWVCQRSTNPPSQYVRTSYTASACDHFQEAFSLCRERSAVRDFSTGWFVTVEDKDPSILWLQNSYCGVLRWISMVIAQPRWELSDKSIKSVLIFYRSLLNILLLRSTLSPVMSLAARDLFYVYPTMKQKCYKTGERMPHPLL